MKSKKLLTAAAIILLQCLFTATLFAQTPPPKQWDKRFGGNIEDGLSSLQQTSDGGYILGGYSPSGIGGDKTEASRGLYDYWVVKIDANGIKQWDKRFGGTSIDYLISLQQTSDGGYILGGESFSGIGGDKTEARRGVTDYWVVKMGCPPAADIKVKGNLDICATDSVKLKVISNEAFEYQWFKNGQKLVGATHRVYTATAIGKYKVLINAGIDCKSYSIALTVTNSCGLIAETGKTSLVVANQPISVYPNPTKGGITLAYSSSKAAAVQLTIFDITGKQVFTKAANAAAGKNVFTLNLSHLAAGIYNLQVNNAGAQQQVRVVIEK